MDHRSNRTRGATARTLLVSLFALAACDCNDGRGGVGDRCSASDPCRSSLVCLDQVCVVPADGSMTSVGLAVLPPSLDLDAPIGASGTTTQFTVIFTRPNGTMVTVTDATFEVDSPAVGTVSPTGLFTATGMVGGTVTVTATTTIDGTTYTDTATITVTVVSTAGGGSGPGSPSDRFSTNTPVTDAAADAEILYPLDGAVMPQNVQPADVQWACASDATPCVSGDMFRVTITKLGFRHTHYVTDDGNQGDGSIDDHLLVPAVEWQALAQSSPNETATIVVDRYEAATNRVVAGTPLSIRFVPTAVTGTVYYWDIDDQTIRAIDDGTSTSRILLPNIVSPENDGQLGDDCVGCHSVSPSGRYMLANTNFSNYGALFDLTDANLSTANPTPYPAGFTASLSKRWRISTWSPDETRAVVSGASGTDNLRLIDPFTGNDVQAHDANGANISLPTTSSHPAWAPDDSFVAYIADINAWAGQTSTGNLRLLTVTDSSMDRFGAIVNLLNSSALAGASEVGATATHGIFYPTWSPDAQYLAFAHGTSSRSDPRDSSNAWNAGDYAHTSALYLIRRDGTGRVRLSRGCVDSVPEPDPMGTSTTRDRSGLDFQPNFSPFEGGGYFWLSFLSRRPYGNRLSGNRDTAADYVQPGGIWVMAVRSSPAGMADPSEVPYWVPGQIPTHRAVSAYWATRACRDNGVTCATDSECCGGYCNPSTNLCEAPPSGMCRAIGQTCAAVSDCCDSATNSTIQCVGNVCVYVVE